MKSQISLTRLYTFGGVTEFLNFCKHCKLSCGVEQIILAQKSYTSALHIDADSSTLRDPCLLVRWVHSNTSAQ